MKNRIRNMLVLLVVFLGFIAGSLWSRAQARQTDTEAPPVACAWREQVSVYYPNQKKLFVYSELGGHCVFAYTLSTAGGPITRENCK
jgi:hypothetical protein